MKDEYEEILEKPIEAHSDFEKAIEKKIIPSITAINLRFKLVSQI